MSSNIVCNGKSSSTLPAQTARNGNCVQFQPKNQGLLLNNCSIQDKLVAEDFLSTPNLNWLIHIAYARRDFNYCKDVIAHQFCVTYDHEYLYFVKVDDEIMNVTTSSVLKLYILTRVWLLVTKETCPNHCSHCKKQSNWIRRVSRTWERLAKHCKNLVLNVNSHLVRFEFLYSCTCFAVMPWNDGSKHWKSSWKLIKSRRDRTMKCAITSVRYCLVKSDFR